MVSVERQPWRIYMIESDSWNEGSSPWFSNIIDLMIKKIQNRMSRRRENRGSGRSAERSCLWRTEGFRYQISFPRDTHNDEVKIQYRSALTPLCFSEDSRQGFWSLITKGGTRKMSFRFAYAAQGFSTPGQSLPLSFFYNEPSWQLSRNTLNCSEAFRVYQRYKLLTCSVSLK